MATDDLFESKAAKNIRKGWIPLFKSLRDHETVGMKKPFSRFEAWVWLLFETEWEDTTKLIDFGGRERMIDCPAGTVTHSERFMAEAFGWSRKKLKTFLAWTEKDGQTGQKVVQQITQITIVNWVAYRELTTKKGTGRYTSKGPARDQQGTKRKETNKLIKKEVKEIKERAADFFVGCKPHTKKYGPALIKHFFEYWTEPNSTKTKMRFELEKTFEISRRISTFQMNADKWGHDYKNGYDNINEDAIRIKFRQEMESTANKTYSDVVNQFYGEARGLVVDWLNDQGIKNFMQEKQ